MSPLQLGHFSFVLFFVQFLTSLQSKLIFATALPVQSTVSLPSLYSHSISINLCGQGGILPVVIFGLCIKGGEQGLFFVSVVQQVGK